MKEEEFTHILDQVIRYKAEDTITQIHDYGLDLRANHIYLSGEEAYAHHESDGVEPGVEYLMASKFIKNLNILQRRSNKPILIHLKSCGGDWNEGMAIYDAIKACPNPITMLNYTHARSMSSLIFLAGDKRVMMPHSVYMFHQGDMEMGGTLKQFLTEAKEAQRTLDQMIDIYVDALKTQGKMKTWGKKRIRDWVERAMEKSEEVYFDAKQSVELGFADEVFGADGVYDWASLVDFDEE